MEIDHLLGNCFAGGDGAAAKAGGATTASRRDNVIKAGITMSLLPHPLDITKS